MKTKTYVILGVIVVGLLVILSTPIIDLSPGKYDEFAKCVTESGAMMYGAYWCPHCIEQKESFGNSWKYIVYKECSLPNRGGQTEECQEAGIESYPTWEFSDGSREQGFVSLSRIAELTGCELP
ncbi:hypothetical protein CMI42_04395 [Candidatus Pacearchaeota archaeon]|nr:hypothetical protein [Candidatus Pacearchaeota archaeon]|tara:strand:- start:4406 stop:4777 length:372 start_codon:yes stop_codon:yes gene_type:complete